jgi:L-alanine-DL-glutamate epimerase-like enolase superfamily enzyme
MYEAMIVASLKLSNGVEALAGLTTYTEHEYDMTAFSSAIQMAPFVLGKNVFEIPKIYENMRRRYVPLGHISTSLFDIALHDGKAKTLGVPIYKMFGEAKNKIQAYSSCPSLSDDASYIDFCKSIILQGYRSIKIHPYGKILDDMRLVSLLSKTFSNTEICWNLDAEGVYSQSEALKMGRLLDNLQWEFFEAPFQDSNLSAYKALSDALDIDVLSSGNGVPDLHIIQLALEMRAWDRIRFDVTSIGGFTGARKAMALASAHGLKGELQSWGYTLTQAANLHFLLSQTNCEYFEQSAPFETYEFGSKNVFRPDDEGYVFANNLPGLGVEMDWQLLNQYMYAHREFSI